MKYSELLEHMASGADIPKEKAKKILEVIFDGIENELIHGRPTNIPGFGTFGTKLRATRTAKHPLTGKNVTVPEHSVIKFTPSKNLKALLRSADK